MGSGKKYEPTMGQKNEFHHDNPVGKTGVKNSRKTGEIPRGTSAMRKAQHGRD